jgi:hypothetical protein
MCYKALRSPGYRRRSEPARHHVNEAKGGPLTQRLLKWLVAGASLAVLTAAAAGGAFAGSAPAKPDVAANFTTQGGVAPQFLQNARTIPHWTFQYTDPTNNVTYPITMVGTDPSTTNTDTAVHTVIVPLEFNFVAGNQDTSILNDLGYAGFRATPVTHTFDGSRRVADVLASPIFQNAVHPAAMGGDTAQVGDAFFRAQFNKIGTSYHVRLVNDSVATTQTIDVPANKGLAYQRPVGAWRTANGLPTDTIAGVVDSGWFSARLQQLMGTLQIDARTVPIFLTDNVMLYSGNYLGCCTIGYHGAGMPVGRGAGSANGNGVQPVQTFIFSAWTTPGTYSGFLADYTNPTRTSASPTRGLADIHALSHEVSEWLDDPYVNNRVKPWVAATAPQYGCTAYLETGDPVVGAWYPLTGNNAGANDTYNYYGQYHPEEEVNAQWFGRGGVEAAGFHSYNNNLTFMGPLTIALGGPWAAFAHYANDC